jgi:hypothetical protein
MRRVELSELARRFGWRRGTVLVGATSVAAILIFVPGIQPGAQADGQAGQQGTDTALPATSSAVTVNGSGSFSDLKVTVNQTQNLENQDVSVTWTGGSQTDSATQFLDNYLQIFQCWSSSPQNVADPGPAPPPTQCEFGGWSINSSSYPTSGPTNAVTRILASQGFTDYKQDQATDNWPNPFTGQEIAPFVDAINGNQLVEPFVSVDGTVVDQQDNTNYQANLNNPQAFWTNPYFSFYTTNEVDFARTYAAPGGGTEGQQNFQMDTGLEAPGLGCGQDSETLPNGSQQEPQCWLVVVPRGISSEENDPSDDAAFVDSSPLTPTAWSNAIDIPLAFNPVGSSCAIGADEQRIEGNEMAEPAVSSWQPALCSTPGAPPYSYSTVSDDEARNNITNASYGAAGMSVFSDPIPPGETDPSNPVVYAPLTLSGIVVAFNIDRDPGLVNGAPIPSEVPLEGTQVENIYLTPRLVAKLLTESYKDQLENVTGDKSSAYSWVQNNPTTLVDDPDFLQYNPEFSLLSSYQQAAAASLIVEETSSDAATAVWNWILSDPEAAAWLNGQPDPWGMKVNPLYSTNPSVNPSGVGFGTPVPESYPQNDPYCYNTGQVTQTSPPVAARPLCILDWSPYALNMNAAAQDVGESNNQSKTTFVPTALTPDTAWTSSGPQVTGTSFIISITDSASAAQYGDQLASLSPSGDDSPNRPFVTPNEQSFLAGEQAMTPSSVPGVLETNSSSTATNAYPLAMLTYAAVTPESLDQPSRQNYATFLQYAAGAGQTPGVNVGQLPAGYAPLPSALQTETVEAAKTILSPPTQGVTATTTPTTSPPVVQSTPSFTPPPASEVTSPAVTSPTTTEAPRIEAAALALNASRQPYFGVGAVRWALLIIVGAGIGATLGTVLVEMRRRKRRAPPPKKSVWSTW